MKIEKNMKFGRLTTLKVAYNKNHNNYWECICDCGKTKIIRANSLTSGNTKSCGCLNKEIITKHDFCKERTYNIWKMMKERCYNKNSKSYHNYGGRGIGVCDSWKSDYSKFREWAMKNGYKHNLTLDRIDNNKEYCPENCRWATLKQQANNRTNNKLLEFNGEIRTMKEWCDLLNLNYRTVKSRLNISNWTVEKALTTPTGRRSKNE